MKTTLPFAISIMLLLPSITHAQNTWTTYTERNGLADNVVYSIAEDLQGNMWFATEEEVCMFTGSSWKTTPVDENVEYKFFESIFVDTKGNIWAGGCLELGIAKFDGKTWKIYGESEGFPGKMVSSIAEDSQGNIWCGTGGSGLSKFDGKNWKTYTKADGLVSNYINTIAIDSHDNVWIGTQGYGMNKFDGKTWTAFREKEGLVYNFVSAIAIDSQDNVWIGTRGLGLNKFDGKSWILYTKSDGMVSGYVSAIAIDANNIWVGSLKDGASKFDGKNWKTYTTKDGLASNEITSIAIDSHGSIWFGTDYYGVCKLSETKGTTAIKNELNHKNPLKIYPNPLVKQSVIKFPKLQNNSYSLEVFSNMGVLVRKIDKIFGEEYVLERGNLFSGIYCYRLYSEKGDSYEGKLLVK